MLCCTFLCCHCTTTTWKYLISRFMEDVWHFQRIGINATLFEKTRMPFQTDVVAVRAPYSVEGAVKKSHLFPVKHSVVDRFRNTSLVPSPCLLARRDFFFFAFVNLITWCRQSLAGPPLHDASYCGPVYSRPLPRPPMRDTPHHAPGSMSLSLFEQQCGFLYMFFSLQLVKEDEGDKANGLMSPPN